MKKKIILGVVVASLSIGAGLGAKKLYVQAEVSGCEKTVLFSLEQQYGDIPDEVKAKIMVDVNNQCRKIL